MAADLGHILEKSSVGAEINVDLIPLSPALRDISKKEALHFALSGGDDYELCFTIPPNKKDKIPNHCTCIGKITAIPRIRLAIFRMEHKIQFRSLKVINIFLRMTMRDYIVPPIPATVWQKPSHFIAFGFGTGAIPYAPGTFGTLIAIPFYLAMRSLSPHIYISISYSHYDRQHVDM